MDIGKILLYKSQTQHAVGGQCWYGGAHKLLSMSTPTCHILVTAIHLYMQAKYSMPGSAGGECCGAHKLPGMVRINTRHCEECDKRATFGVLGAGASHFLHSRVNLVFLTAQQLNGCFKQNRSGAQKTLR